MDEEATSNDSHRVNDIHGRSVIFYNYPSMKPLFRSTLNTYNELARAEHEPVTDQKILEEVKRWHIERETTRWATPSQVQEEIYALQQHKQEILKKLHRLFQEIDADEPIQWHEAPDRLYPVWQEGPHLFARLPDGTTLPLSIGTLLTDTSWGTGYRLDTTVSKHLRKRYVFESAKAELHQAMNEQIAKNGRGSSQAGAGPRGMYNAFLRNGLREPGHQAERFVRSFLKKLILDHHLDLQIIDGDIHQDAEQKIDFIIRRIHRERGVHVEESAGDKETYEIVGVQLATGKKPHKQSAINLIKPLVKESDNIQDILLIKVGRGIMLKAIRQWQDHGCPPGGPELFVSIEKQERLFRRLLYRIVSAEDIERTWGKIMQSYRRRP